MYILGVTSIEVMSFIGRGTLMADSDITHSYTEFLKWKELEEEATYTTYVQKQTSYQPKLNNGK